MQEPYWAVFNEGRLTYLGLSQGEALEFLRINGGSSVEQIRSLDQLAEALHRHKADHEEKLAEAIVDIPTCIVSSPQSSTRYDHLDVMMQ